jgi:hypothetical protein
MAAGTTITNWFGDLVSHPRVVVEATSVNDIVKILIDPDQYPSPVRAVGSNHSTSPVGVAEGGTLNRCGPRTPETRHAVLRQHGDRQPVGGQRVLRRDRSRPRGCPGRGSVGQSNGIIRAATVRERPGQLVNCETEC